MSGRGVNGYAQPSVKPRRSVFTVPPIGQALSASLARLQAEFGGKNLAEYFDGREGESVAVSTISRWIGEPRRFPAVFLPTLVELDPEFRADVLRLLLGRLLSQDELLRELEPRVAAEVARAQDELLRRILHGPGGLGEAYS